MIGALDNTKKVSKKDKSKVINIVAKQPIATPFKTVARDQTIEKKNEITRNL